MNGRDKQTHLIILKDTGRMIDVIGLLQAVDNDIDRGMELSLEAKEAIRDVLGAVVAFDDYDDLDQVAGDSAAGAYEDWLAAVDRATQAMIGQSVYDLPDPALDEWYAAGMEPAAASDLAIMDAGFTRVYK